MSGLEAADTDLQNATRHPFLDLYFHCVSLLGTHSAVLVCLPLFFWFVSQEIGFKLMLALGAGILNTSILKDLLCMPRPYSPPVQRFSLVGSHAKEYGWPSTHSTNAVNIALICAEQVGPTGKIIFAIYAVSIILGRIYSGMHSISDCITGTILAVLQHYFLLPHTQTLIRFASTSFGETSSEVLMDTMILIFSLGGPLIVAAILGLITIHPQPLDPCPCFEDTVAMISVVQGFLLGHWLNGLLKINELAPLRTPSKHGLLLLYAMCAAKVLIGRSRLPAQLLAEDTTKAFSR